MKIAVLGTGMVGQALAGRFAELGHEVAVGTRDVQATLARTEPDAMGNPPLAVWARSHPDIRLATFAGATVDADVVVNATNGLASLDVLGAAGSDQLAGRVVLDVSNPMDLSRGFPPFLSVSNTDSLAEQIQRTFPDAKVVKSLNTMNADVMVHPELVGGGDHSVFVSGDDAAAKQVVTGLLHEMGHPDVIDLGDVTTARGPEMMLPVWVRLMQALGTSRFQYKIVR